MGSSFSSAENDRTFPDPVENQKVVKMEKMSVPMDSTKGWLPHLGVKVTTDTGNEYMVHKAGKPGQEGRETATEVRRMSDPKIRPEEWQKKWTWTYISGGQEFEDWALCGSEWSRL